MQLSNKIIYGLQFLLQLCEADENHYSQVKDIASKESISEKYLEHVVAQLKSTGLIEVKRGAKGGYRLSRQPNRIKLSEIYSSLEKLEIKPIDSINSHNDTLIKKTVFDFLSEFEEIVKTFLHKKTLADLHLKKAKLIEYINFQI